MALVEENFSIIVPTYQEAKNISQLVARIANINFGNRHYEMIIIDDNSQDGTNELMDNLCKQYSWLKLLVRRERPGLSESVIAGFSQAQFPNLIIMDADLSHPPEKIPDMLAALSGPNVDMVIGSRYIAGGSTDQVWPLRRKWASKLAALIAQNLIASQVKDPLSGFLAIKKTERLTRAALDPIGWKISLEIMVKCHYKNIKEVPIHFAERTQGTSKLNIKVVYYYLLHIKRLILYKMFNS